MFAHYCLTSSYAWVCSFGPCYVNVFWPNLLTFKYIRGVLYLWFKDIQFQPKFRYINYFLLFYLNFIEWDIKGLLIFSLVILALRCISYTNVDFVVTGGPSGSGKTSLAHKMANIVGCEVVSLESYYKSERVKDFKYDDFSSLDLSLLSKVRLQSLCVSHLTQLYFVC